MGSIKKQPVLIDKKCTQCYKPTHLKFNFSFISYAEGFTKEHKACMIDRLIELSSEPYLVVFNLKRLKWALKWKLKVY